MKSLAFSKEALDSMRELKSDAKRFTQVASRLFALLLDSAPNDSQALKGSSEGFRRIDQGEYRIVYMVSGEVITIALVEKRNDDQVYRAAKRKGITR